MKDSGHEKAIQAMQSLEFFQPMYASSSEYQQHLQHVLAGLRHYSTCAENYGQKKFLLAFADALEVANLPGAYVDRQGVTHE